MVLFPRNWQRIDCEPQNYKSGLSVGAASRKTSHNKTGVNLLCNFPDKIIDMKLLENYVCRVQKKRIFSSYRVGNAGFFQLMQDPSRIPPFNCCPFQCVTVLQRLPFWRTWLMARERSPTWFVGFIFSKSRNLFTRVKLHSFQLDAKGVPRSAFQAHKLISSLV